MKIRCEHCNVVSTFDDISALFCKYCGAPMRSHDDLIKPQSALTKTNRLLSFVTGYFGSRVLSTQILPLDQMAAHIIDISKWQYKWDGSQYIPPDFDKMKNETDMIHVICKASQGVLPDPCYEIGVSEMTALDIKYGTYHYCDTRLDPILSANRYAEQVNAVPENQRWGISAYPQHWLDCEYRIDPDGKPLSQTALTAWIKGFVDRLEALIDQPFGIYTREIWWNDYVLRNDWAHKYALWIARYNSWITDPGAPLDWSNYGKVAALWQRDADGNGLGDDYGVWSKSVDRNRSPIYTRQEIENIINGNDPPVNIVPPDYLIAHYYDGTEYTYTLE